MNRTKIEYLDYTWNPTVGCNGVGCAVREDCWARAMAKRQKHRCQLCYEFKPHVHIQRFDEPFSIKEPRKIGVSFMGDFFDEGIYESWRREVFHVVRACGRHMFVFLTKQPQNIPVRWVLPENVWLGVTINCKKDLWRLEKLKSINAAVKFVSFEPLYEDLGDVDLAGIDWVIIGAQTRPNLQPNVNWVLKLVEQADFLKIPVFLKDNLQGFDSRQEFPQLAVVSTVGLTQKRVEGGCLS